MSHARIAQVEIVGIQRVDGYLCRPAVSKGYQVGGIYLYGYVLIVNVDAVLAKADIEHAVFALKFKQLDVVVGGCQFYDAVLRVALNHLYIAHASHRHLFECRQVICFCNDRLARVNHLATKVCDIPLTRSA